MSDPAQQLARIYQAGFDVEHFERLPNAVGVVRDGCIALLRATPTGFVIIGAPGWRMGEVMGVLVEKQGRPVFQAKDRIENATPERRQKLKDFEASLKDLLAAQ